MLQITLGINRPQKTWRQSEALPFRFTLPTLRAQSSLLDPSLRMDKLSPLLRTTLRMGRVVSRRVSQEPVIWFRQELPPLLVVHSFHSFHSFHGMFGLHSAEMDFACHKLVPCSISVDYNLVSDLEVF